MISQTLLNRYERDLVLKGFSPRTRGTYYRNIIWFFNHTKEDPDKISGEAIKDYLYDKRTPALIQNDNYFISSKNISCANPARYLKSII